MDGGWWSRVVGRVSGPERGLRAARREAVRDVERDLRDLEEQVRVGRSRLPGDVQWRLDDLMVLVTELIYRGDAVAASPERLQLVARTVDDYVPTALRAYLNLPSGYAANHREDGGPTAREQLVEQLLLLHGELTEVLEEVHADEARALKAHGAFLKDRFHRSSLDL